MQQTKVLDGPFLHMVFFWLKDPDSESAKTKFINALQKFIDNTPGIKTKHIGTPADTSRPVIDSSYTFSLVVSFNDQADHDTYQEHPYHKEFIAIGQELWEKVQVYDSILSNIY